MMSDPCGRGPRAAPASGRASRARRLLRGSILILLALTSCGRSDRELGILTQVGDSLYVGDLRPGWDPARRAIGVTTGPPGRILITGRRPATVPHIVDDKISPDLLARIATANPGQTETLFVALVDDQTMVRFPLGRATPDSNLAGERTRRARTMAAKLDGKRVADMLAYADSLHAKFHVRPIGHGWLVRSVEIVLPLARIKSLAALREVTSIEPLHLRGAPPQPQAPGCGGDDPATVLRQVGLDAYLDAGYTGGRIALLDTGVDTDHVLLANCGRFGAIGYCTSPGDLCREDPDLGADYDESGHGTSVAALLISDGAGDPCLAGLTRATLDCYRVYRRNSSEPDGVQPVHGAIDRGFRTAMERQDAVILPELDVVSRSASQVAQAAERAVAAGFVVVAPIGNHGVDSPGAPGRSSAVLAVGGFRALDGATLDAQAYVSDPDVLPKPDLQAPGGMRTARLGGAAAQDAPPADVWQFNGTSGSVPVAVAAAAFLREHLLLSQRPIDPGQVYATMLACTEPADPARMSDTEVPAMYGAGRLKMPVGGRIWWGAVDVPRGQSVAVHIDPAGAAEGVGSSTPPGGSGGPVRRLDIAIWWSEPMAFDGQGYPKDTHDDVNLDLIDPSGNVTSSRRFPGVWERLRAKVPDGSTGTWTVRIVGDDMVNPTHRVYVAVIGTP